MTHSDEAPDSIVVVGPDGQPLVIPADAGTPLTGQVVTDSDKKNDGSNDREDSGESLADMVEQPAKVMRIGTMIKQLLEEVRAAPLDDASRTRLKEIHTSSVRELEQGLAPELRDELERLTLPFTDDTVPSDAELRIAQAQLVGWLEGLFHGIQTALFAQQMAARAQLEQMRQGALPPGIHTADTRGGRGDQAMGGSGQYL
ncbi:bacterial proteasome activator family protein [Nocardia amikacinitolerans]|uniref:bacterial proteasome activator family protein n=1 Tax=Nocardia amikacinitolerans TaxID=756689 RepID=UPI0020A56A4A|nr:bacterial proteasome activator family protein [Nocardia amikacinitolerans]